MTAVQKEVAITALSVMRTRARKAKLTPVEQSRAAVILLITGIVESHLRNVDYGDRDSLGWLQQRPSQGWGTPEQVTNVMYATNKFIDVLFKVRTWKVGDYGAVAQAVQRSAYPDRYARYVDEARRIIAELTGLAVATEECAAQPSVDQVLANGTWTAPMAKGTYGISSAYGNRWHPVLGGWKFHSGIDLGAPVGTPVRAASSGEVVAVQPDAPDKGWGNVVVIRHGSYFTLYAHLSRFAPDIQKGAHVRTGQWIGDVGETGRVAGAHLHFNVCTGLQPCLATAKDGKGTLDPVAFLKKQGVSL
jgi:murein DD-endopeptidase MepM/ murein hydrolase activator NlpD